MKVKKAMKNLNVNKDIANIFLDELRKANNVDMWNFFPVNKMTFFKG